MTGNVWNELALSVPEWFARPTPKDTPQVTDDDGAAVARPRAWPPILMRDFLRGSPACALTVSLDTCLGQVIDFLAAAPGNVVAVADGNNVLGVLFEDWAVDAVREDGMQALDLPVSEIMEAAPWCCDVSDSPCVVIAECEARHLRRAPIVKQGRIVGAADLAALRRFLDAAA